MNNEGTKKQSLEFEIPEWKRVQVPPVVERLATIVVDCAFAVHKELGPGLLESAYEACLSHELRLRGVNHQLQLPVPLVELKSIDHLLPLHTAQVITYLRLVKFPLGLLINFNEVLIKHGIHRILNVPRSRGEMLG